jgi:hypothetical protein
MLGIGQNEIRRNRISECATSICLPTFWLYKSFARASCANCTTYCVHRIPRPTYMYCYRSFIPVLPRRSRPAVPLLRMTSTYMDPLRRRLHGGTYTLSVNVQDEETQLFQIF